MWVRIGYDIVDFNHGEIANFKTFSAIITDFIFVEITDFAFQAADAIPFI